MSYVWGHSLASALKHRKPSLHRLHSCSLPWSPAHATHRTMHNNMSHVWDTPLARALKHRKPWSGLALPALTALEQLGAGLYRLHDCVLPWPPAHAADQYRPIPPSTWLRKPCTACCTTAGRRHCHSTAGVSQGELARPLSTGTRYRPASLPCLASPCLLFQYACYCIRLFLPCTPCTAPAAHATDPSTWLDPCMLLARGASDCRYSQQHVLKRGSTTAAVVRVVRPLGRLTGEFSYCGQRFSPCTACTSSPISFTQRHTLRHLKYYNCRAF